MCCHFTVQIMNTKKSGYIEPKLGYFLCQGIYRFLVKIHVRPSHKIDKKNVHQCIFGILLL